MPPVRNGQYVNVDDRSTSSLHLGTNQVIESTMSMHVQPLQSPNAATILPTPPKQCNQYGSPSMQHPSGSQQPIHQTPLTKAELRKSNKPIMEKKRRARINHCLNELKTLILEAMKKDPARHTKLEKADILEMTVKYLQAMQRNQMNATNVPINDPTILYKFKAGFSDCTNEVSRYINQIDGVDATVKQRLMGHLNNCVTGIQQVASPYNSLGSSSNSNYSYRSSTFSGSPDLFGNPSSNNGTNPLYQQLPLNLPVTPEINNNNRIQMGGVQFIPSRLPSGEFALVMPNSGSANEQWKPFYPVESLPLRQNALDLNDSLPHSAFSNVTKSTKHLDSSPLSPASSMSSIDDSSMNQSDLQTSVDTSSPQRTPQQCLSAFPTPPSGGSITLIPTSHSSQLQNSTITSATSLQQPHVTSTTEQSVGGSSISSKIRPLSLELSIKDSELENISDLQIGKKRSHSSQTLGNKIDDNEPLLKIAKSEPKDGSMKSEESSNDDQSEASNGDMWRPW